VHLVRLTTCADGFEARILAARLGAEGIVWSLRGGQDGPLALGAVDLLVEADDLELARALVATDDAPAPLAMPEAALTGGSQDPNHEVRFRVRDLLLTVAVAIVVVLFALARMGALV
jgi:hypothetical protein